MVMLCQVAQFANAVMRLSHKMHQTGRLSVGEHDLLHSHMSLLDGSVQQLRPSSCDYLLHPTGKSEAGADHQKKKKIDSASTPYKTAKKGRRRLRREFHDKACLHCQTHYTSQWRTGPAGPSTLCNACGIRYARQVRQGQHGVIHSAPTPAPSQPPTRSSVNYLLN